MKSIYRDYNIFTSLSRDLLYHHRHVLLQTSPWIFPHSSLLAKRFRRATELDRFLDAER